MTKFPAGGGLCPPGERSQRIARGLLVARDMTLDPLEDRHVRAVGREHVGEMPGGVVAPQLRELTLDPPLAGAHALPHGGLRRGALAVGIERDALKRVDVPLDLAERHLRVAARVRTLLQRRHHDDRDGGQQERRGDHPRRGSPRDRGCLEVHLRCIGR